MKLYCLSFSDRGESLAQRIISHFGGESARCRRDVSLDEWTRKHFLSANVLVYIGACGIAVRAAAPYIKSKITDPAILVIDEMGTYVIPLLSGHIGGANESAEKIAKMIGALPVITTATDIGGRFAVDAWAVKQHLKIKEPERIVCVSSKTVSGESIGLFADETYRIRGTLPEDVCLCPRQDADVIVSHKSEDPYRKDLPHALHLIPANLTLGIGCKKGIPYAVIEKRFAAFCEHCGLETDAFFQIASIDIKKEEPGILQFARMHELRFLTFDANTRRELPGTFSSSPFVASVTGVDNVCERSAVCAGGTLTAAKESGDGVTFAAALKEIILTF